MTSSPTDPLPVRYRCVPGVLMSSLSLSALGDRALPACRARLQPGGVRPGGQAEQRAYMGRVERGQRNGGVVNLQSG